MKRVLILAVAMCAALALAGPAGATNGMNMIGTTAVSSAMGGADMAVPSGCTAVSANPAQLSQTCDRVVSVGASFLMPSLNVKLSGQPGTDGEDQIFPLPFVGYAQRIGATRWSAGIGLFAQGGMGVDFRDVQIQPGAKDHLYSNIAYMRLAPTVAYNVSDKLSLGATFFLGYATAEYDFYPNSPNGQKVEGLKSATFSGRLGMRYEINDQWSIGAAYTTESTIDYDNGTMDMNFGPGMGIVKYRDVNMSDFTWPRQVDLGVAFQATPKLLLALDLSWINWASAIETVTVTAKDPSVPVPAGFDTLTVPFIMNWDDQYVIAIGAEYELNDQWKLRGGYNYGNNPVPSDTLNPLFPAIIEHHLTAGFGYMGSDWDFDFALEHAFKNTETNDGAPSSSNPFSGAEVSHSQTSVHAMLSYRF